MKTYKAAFCALLLCTSLTSYAEFQGSYTPPRTQAELSYANDLRNGQVLEKLSAVLNKFLFVKDRVEIVGRSCGVPNAFYDARTKSITLCYELLADNAKKLKRIFAGKLPQEQILNIYNSEVTFVVLHEVGHGVIDLFKLPVLGREEDAADKFAAFMLLNHGAAHVLQNATMFFNDTAIAKFDRFVDEKWAQLNGGSSIYGDEHSLDQQRLANVACWGYGVDPTQFYQLVQAIKMPSRRQSMCHAEAEKMFVDIKGLLGDRLLNGQSTR
jgi:Putative metallopeptidase